MRPARLGRATGAAFLVLGILLGMSASRAQDGHAQQQAPVLIFADEIVAEEATGVVTASGNVEVTAGAYTLLAAQVVYDARADTVRAFGEVAMLQPNGDVIFADEVALSDGLRNGFISGIRVLLADRSRMAGAYANRIAGDRTVITRAVFTACDTCAGDPNPPAWQVKASHVIHDEEARRIAYHNARLEFFGIPVLYTPYFSHPDPTVDRQSGFLAPSYATSTHLGLKVDTPYYFNLAPHRDATFTPIFTSREGIVLAGEYRERTRTGQWRAEGSVTNPDERIGAVRTGERDLRGHLRAEGEFAIDPVWRWGFDAARTTDDTYLRRYGLADEDSLASNVFLEGIDGRNYAAVNAWAFQGLREDDDPGQTPLVLPMIDYSLVSDPGDQGQTVRLDASAMALTRNEGTDSWRFSAGSTWRLPYTAPLGDIYTLTAGVRGDLYYVSSVPNPDGAAEASVDGFVGRVLPQVALDWRFPFVRTGQRAEFLVEPIAAVIVAPHGGNPSEIPNEDSLSFEFDDANLFSPNRFPGLDRWEGGPRLNYGMRVGAYGTHSTATALIGQTVRTRENTQFDERSGLRETVSDYVGRATLDLPNLQYVQRFRMDRDSYSFRRNEIALTVGPETLNFTLGYVYLGQELSTENLGRREELLLSARAPLTDSWYATARSRHDLSTDGGLLLSGFGLVYECDCMRLSIDLVRRLTRDRDIPPSTEVTLRLYLRNLT